PPRPSSTFIAIPRGSPSPLRISIIIPSFFFSALCPQLISKKIIPSPPHRQSNFRPYPAGKLVVPFLRNGACSSIFIDTFSPKTTMLYRLPVAARRRGVHSGLIEKVRPMAIIETQKLSKIYVRDVIDTEYGRLRIRFSNRKTVALKDLDL